MDPEPVERRPAAILSADVVGYSRLLAEPGGIFISGAVRDPVESKLDPGFEDLSERHILSQDVAGGDPEAREVILKGISERQRVHAL